MSTRIVLDITDPNIKEKLAVLPEKMLDYADEVITSQAHLIVGIAQVYCPVDTGSLRDSIRVERGGQGLHWREVRIRAGGYITNPRTNNIVNYAAYVEAKTPFLAPAVEEVKPTIDAMLKAGVIKNV